MVMRRSGFFGTTSNRSVQDQLFDEVPKDLHPLLGQPDGAPAVIEKLREMYLPRDVATVESARRAWECCALLYWNERLVYQALEVASALYKQMILFQNEAKTWVHKGMPLVYLRDFHLGLNHPVTAKRYAMLTLCEDAIRDLGGHQGRIDAAGGGIYFRLAFEHGMSDSDISRYAQETYELCQKNPVESQYPEWILQELDNEWMVEFPTPQEAFTYVPNRHYVAYLIGQLGEPSGKALERLSEYLLSLVPGFRVHSRQRTPSTDYDIVCRVEGEPLDFRAELGRYMLCECKDWSANAVDFSTVAKFESVLASAKCKSGIIFSPKGVSGEDKRKLEDAKRQQLKAFQKDGTTILVVGRSDLDAIAAGANFIAMLRKKYEQVRLDLEEPKSANAPNRSGRKGKPIARRSLRGERSR